MNNNIFHSDDLWVKTLHELMVLKNMIDIDNNNTSKAGNILESISYMIVQYTKVISFLKTNIQYSKDVIESMSSMVMDFHTRIENGISSFEDNDIILQIRSHTFYIMFLDQVRLFKMFRSEFIQILGACETNFIKNEKDVDHMTLDQFISYVKNMIYMSHNMRRSFSECNDTGLHIQNMYETMNTILEEIRSALFIPGDDHEIIRNDNIKLDFQTSALTPDIKTTSCSICLEPYSEQKDIVIAKLKCGHNFHLKCISESVKYQQKCPLCRSTDII